MSQQILMVPYHGTTISFSWDFCYTFLHTSYYLEEVSEMKKKKRKKKTSVLRWIIIYSLWFFSNLFTNLCNEIVIFRLGPLSVLTTSNVYSGPRNIFAPTTSIFHLLYSKVSKTSCHFEPKQSLYTSHGAAKLD